MKQNVSFRSATALLLLSSLLKAQTTYFTLVRSPDAREIAMGESFVGGPLSSFSIENNPANLSQLKGMSTFYSYRDLKWFDFFENFQMVGTGAMIQTSYGNVAFLYKRFTLGEIAYTISGPDPSGTFNQVDQSYVVGFASELSEVVAVGVNAKIFNRKAEVLSGTINVPNSNNSYLLDAGFLFSFGGIAIVPNVRNRLQLGLSLQNFGTDFETGSPGFATVSQNSVDKLPRFARGGFSYSIESHPGELYFEVKFLLTAEYRRSLNPQGLGKNYEDFWGFGMEIGALQIAAIRLGGIIQPYQDVFADAGKLAMRYGFGIRLPARMFDIPYPLIVSFDYTAVPINGNVFGGQRKTLPAVQIQVSYEFDEAK